MVKVGVIGCGRIACWMHLPNLADFDGVLIHALCDLDEQRLKAAERRYRVRHVTHDFEDLLRMRELDAVIVATEDVMHAPITLAALAAGKHVFVEKPMCLTIRDADELVAAAKDARRVLMVGFQKCYDPAVELTQRLLHEIGQPRLIHIQDICHDNDLVLNDILLGYATGEWGYTDGVDTVAWKAVGEELFPDVAPPRRRCYRLLLNLACHDISLLLRLFGDPCCVEFADIWSEDPFAVAILDYGGATKCVVEVGQTKRKWFDEKLLVYSTEATLRVEWPSPFLKNAPTMVFLDKMDGRVEEQVRCVASYDEAFRRELIAFLDCIKTGATPLTSAEHGRAVLKWLLEIIRRSTEGSR